ncbi:MAG TPA: thioredoxin family protein [Tenuifilaceae bacterium]|nr:thioredoxin family protein [Tenuifilaceae bacterium]HPE17292.1 thioredoxin family protein [Tenuifilaceae bacterium]HPJ44518.1 thioredoxin family protein [Tenuifilaceae bacterium]HPQ33056.1 thioredoxin family protein [Tenuifilaceae bacterium]HRX67749.1 thioredoxin family protein [Tenuifilaceae bacterium]
MKKVSLLLLMVGLAITSTLAQGYKIGDKATDFSLKNVDEKMVSLADYTDANGFIVIFSCNHCPYVKAYENRMVELHNKYASKGFPVVAINSNDPKVQPEDSFEKMKERAKEKNFPFKYLFDEDQKVYPIYGATRTPHVFLLNKNNNDLIVEYIGTIDDNYKDASAVKEKYLENAVDALLAGEKPKVTETKAIGCSIKVKK